MFLALLGSASAVSPSPPSPPPAPPCTLEMLRLRPAGDKSWPIACSHTKLGNKDNELDLSGAHLSYGDFEEATFKGKGVIKLNGTSLTHADLSGSKVTALASSRATVEENARDAPACGSRAASSQPTIASAWEKLQSPL